MTTKRMTALLAILTLGLLPMHLSHPTAATATPQPNTVYLFVEIEAKVYRKNIESAARTLRKNAGIYRTSLSNRKTCRLTLW
jgi:hypothetical protein